MNKSGRLLAAVVAFARLAAQFHIGADLRDPGINSDSSALLGAVDVVVHHFLMTSTTATRFQPPLASISAHCCAEDATE